MKMMKLLVSIAATGLVYLVGKDFRHALIFGAVVVSTTVYFALKKSKKVDTLHVLTVLLTLAATVLPRLRGEAPTQTAAFYVAILSLIPYDLTYAKRIWYASWLGFWFFISYGLFEVVRFKLNQFSFLVVLAIVPIAVRDLFERRKGCGREVCPLSNERSVDNEGKS